MDGNFDGISFTIKNEGDAARTYRFDVSVSNLVDQLSLLSGKTKSAVRRKGWSESTRSNVEESLTVAEQLARREGMSGYYHFVPVNDKETGRWRSPTDAEARAMCEQDRKLFSDRKQLNGDKSRRVRK